MKRPLVLFLFGFIGFTLMSFFAENASVSLGLMIFILAVIFYFIPTIISSERKTAHFNMILFINLVFGWTVLGWIVALVWAATQVQPRLVPPAAPPLPPRGSVLAARDPRTLSPRLPHH